MLLLLNVRFRSGSVTGAAGSGWASSVVSRQTTIPSCKGGRGRWRRRRAHNAPSGAPRFPVALPPDTSRLISRAGIEGHESLEHAVGGG